MRIIGLLPARGGSKTIPNKNIHNICGKPMISYGIEALKNSNIDVYVSTNDPNIANISSDYGAKIISRPEDISRDNSPTIDCIKHTIEYLNLINNDIIILIQPTSPMIISSDIINGLKIFHNGDYESLVSVTKNHSILWHKKGDYIIPANHTIDNRIRRQDMKTTFAETGSLYIFRVENIIKYNTMYGSGKVGYIEISKSRSFEIDDYEDIKIIEALINV